MDKLCDFCLHSRKLHRKLTISFVAYIYGGRERKGGGKVDVGWRLSVTRRRDAPNTSCTLGSISGERGEEAGCFVEEVDCMSLVTAGHPICGRYFSCRQSSEWLT